ncbi:hypothetical protein B7L28_07165 [Veillonella atypica]|uniref:ESPR-type extended signal peptide-containing protein n=1 Tax=Veillonella atypica TaxID=39777 RepID=UPI0009E0F455|nr:ESPR-type extended signal peptide-containing protein [Veillonella atypica]ARF99767.1 hypothetical protein B7L28_07165 [Veillonella atypica]
MGLNHIYKVIWSKTKNAWVVVSEIAKRDGKSSVKSVVTSLAGKSVAAVMVAMVMCGGVASAFNHVGTNIVIGGDSLAVGEDIDSQGGQSLAIGIRAKSDGTGTTLVIGNDSKVVHTGMVVGNQSEGTYVIGQQSKGSFVLGNYSNSNHGGMVLGNNNNDDGIDASQTTYAPINGVQLNYSSVTGGGATIGNTLSVGNKLSYQFTRITNVAAGNIAPNSTDAINGSQLYEAVRAVSAGASPDVYMHVNDGTSTQGAGNATSNLGKVNEKGGATGQYSIAIGYQAKASGSNSLSIGSQNIVEGDTSTVVGSQSYFSNTARQSYGFGLMNGDSSSPIVSSDSYFIGARNKANKVGTSDIYVLGRNNEIKSTSVYAVGASNIITDSDATSIYGFNNNITKSPNSIVIGQGVQIDDAVKSLFIGTGRISGKISASADDNQELVAIGYNNTFEHSGQKSSITLGNNNRSTGSNRNIIIGTSNVVGNGLNLDDGTLFESEKSGIFGNGYGLIGKGTYYIGNSTMNDSSTSPATSRGLSKNSGVFGNDSFFGGYTGTIPGSFDANKIVEGSRIIGNNSQVAASDVMAIGNNILVQDWNMKGAVVLGSNSWASQYVKPTDSTINGDTFTSADYAGQGTTTNPLKIGNIISVGYVGNERQIKNVAAGEVTATSTDAINGSQLYSVADQLAKGGFGYMHVNDGTTTQKAGTTATNYGAGGSKGGAIGNYAIAGGVNAAASGENSIAIGRMSNATANWGVALGYQSRNNAGSSIAIGSYAEVSKKNSIAIGSADFTTSTPSSPLPTGGTVVNGEFSIALAAGAQISGDSSIGIGRGVTIEGNSNIGIGKYIATQNLYGIQSENNVAIGSGSGVIGQKSVVIGYNGDGAASNIHPSIFANESVIIGTNSTIFDGSSLPTSLSDLGVGNHMIGNRNRISYHTNNALVVGNDSSAKGDDAIAIGHGAKALAEESISIGTGNEVKGAKSSAIGDPSYIDTTATGTHVQGNDNGTATNPIKASESTFMGNTNLAGTAGTTGIHVVGNSNTVDSSNVMVMGNGVTVGTGLDGAVVLGNASSADQYAAATDSTINGVTFEAAGYAGNTGLNKGSIVSVGATGTERQIKNVAAGAVTATSTDAVNGSQLYKTAETILKMPINMAGDSGDTVGLKLGKTVNIKGSVASGADVTDGNIAVVGDKATSTLSLKMAKNLTGLTSGTFTDASGNQTVINGAGVTVTPTGTGATSISITTSGINAGTQEIKGVKKGTTDDAAVNKKQMDDALAGISSTLTINDGTTDGSVNIKTGKLKVVGESGTNALVTTTVSGDTISVGTSTKLQNAVTAAENSADKDLSNLSTTGSDKVKTLAQDAVKVAGTGLATVSDATAAGVKTYTVNVDEGKLVIDDTTGKIGAAGASQGTVQGKDGVATTQNVASVVNSAIDKTKQALDDAKHNFAGDDATVISRKHGEQLNIKGGASTTATDLTSGNIAVVGDTTSGTLNIKMAKDLTGLTSATYTDAAGNTQTVTGGSSTISDAAGNSTVVSKGGVTTTDAAGNTTTTAPTGVIVTPAGAGATPISVTTSGISAGNKEIKNVGKATTDDAAVNKKQMDDALKGATDNTVSLGSESGTTTAKKLSTTGGIKFNIKGETGANALITTSASGDDVTIAPTAKLTAAVTAAEKSADKDLSNLSAAGDTYIKNLAKSAASWNVETNGAGTTAVAGGDTVNFIDGDNIAITNTGRSITIGTAKNVSFDKVTVGGVVIDKTDGINAGGKEIKGVATGTAADSAVNKAQMDAAITAAAGGSLSTEKVVAKTLTGDNNLATVAGQTGTAKGETYEVSVSENAVKAVAATAAQDAVKVAGTGLATVSDATAAGVKTYTVNVDEGKLVIDDTTGKLGAAGATQGTVQGKDGVATTQNVASVVNSAIDKTKQALDDAKHNFAGDDATVISRKHGEQLNIKGGASTTATDLTSGNIAVVGDTTTGTLNIKLAKVLTGLTSATYTDGAGNTQTVTGGSSTISDAAGNSTVVSKGGVTTTDGTNTTTVAPSGVTATDGTNTVKLNGSGIDAGNTQIKNVGKATTDDAAVNKKQMDDAVKAATDSISTLGDNKVSLGSDSGTTTAKKLSTTGGIKFNIKGDTGANALITTSATGDDVTIAPTAKLTAAVTAAENAANKDLSNLNAAGDTYIKNLAKSAASWNVESNGAGTTAVAGGDTVNFINGDNIAITNTGRSITIGTAKNVSFDKVTVGGVVIDKTDGINAGGKEIKGVATGTAADSAVNKAQMDAAITAAAGGSLSTEKVVAKTLTGDNNLATVAGQTGTAKGETYEVSVSENAVKAVAKTAAQDAVKVAGTGLATVSDATAAGVKTYTVNVDEGKLVIDDTTGKVGAAGSTQGTTAGKNGVATTQDVASVVNSAIDKTKQALDDAKHDFAGDDATVISRKHGEQLNIKGGASTTATDLTSGNIAVVGDTTSGTLNIKMVKALTGLTSATYTDAAGNTQTVTGGSSTISDAAGHSTVVSKGGVTTTDGTNTTTVAPSGITATDGTHTVTLGGSGISAGGTEIKNVGKATTDDAAVNKKQMDDAVKAATDSISTLGDNKVSLGSDSGTTTAKKLSTTGGIKFNIKGETGANALITTSATGDDVTIAPTAKLTAAVTAAENAANKDLSNLNAAGDTYIKNLAKSAASWNVETNGAGTTAVAGGDTVNFINGDNIAITNTGRSITIGTSRDVSFDKVTVGGIVLDKNTGINAGGKEIKGVANATSADAAVNKGQLDAAVLSAAGGALSIEKVEAGSVANGKLAAGDNNLASVSGLTGTAKNETYTVTVSENAVKAVAQTAAQDAVKVAGTGLATVSDATAAGVKTYTVNVDEGKLVIDDTTGKIGANGATQGTVQGKNGVATTQDVASVVNSAIDKTKQALTDAKHDFAGDDATVISRKHGEQLNIKGGASTTATDLTSGNIAVVGDTTTGTLNIKLAKALTGLTSATYTDAAGNTQTVTGGSSTITDGAGNTTTITKGGMTTTDGTNTTTVAPAGVTATDGTNTVKLTGSGIDAGNTQIKNVGKATTDDAAVNKKQMDDAVKAATDSISTLGDNKVSLGSDSGTTTAKKLSTTGGIKFNIKGDTGANALITTSATGDDVTIAPTAKLTAAVTAAEKSADKDLSNISTAGETVIKNLAATSAQDAVKVTGTGLATVTDSTTGGVKTYNVDVKTGNLVVTAAGQAGATGTTGAGGAAGADGVATTQNVASAINDAITKSKTDTAQAIADAEHKFDGDTGATSVRKHGEVLSIKGGVTATTDLTTGNIGVVSDGAGTLNIRLAKVLSGLTSASFTTAGGDSTVINGNGVTITPSATGASPISMTTAGINAGNKEIKGVATGTTADAAVNKAQMDAAITAAAGGSLSTEKVVAKTLTGDNNLVTVTGQTGTAKGETYEVAVSENAVKAVAQTAAQDAVKVTGTGLANVTDSTTGGVKTYNVDVKTGNLVVTAAGQVGANGTTGAGGAAGADGVATTQNVASAINDAITKSKTDTAQAIADAEHKFDGDTGTTSVRKHGEVLSVKGGVTATTDLTTGNIGVVSDGAGTLNIRLAKVLSGLTSATYTDGAGNTQTVTGGSSTITDGAGNTTTITKGGVTTTDGTNTTTVAPAGVTATDGTNTVKLTGSGIDAGNTQIKNVGKATTDDAAVNKKQMDDAVKAATDSISTLGDNKVSLGSDSGTTTAKKLSTTGGIKFNIKGDTGANALITTSATGDDVTIAPTAKLSAAVTAAENSANKDLSNLSTAGDTYIKNLAKTAASWNVETNGAGTTAVAGGDTVNFINGDNIAITNTGRSITIGTAKNVSFDKITVGGVVIDKNNGIDAGGKEITNVGPATSGNSAVNKTQMDTAIANAQTAATSTEKVVAKTLTGDTNLVTVTGQTGTAKGETYEVAVSENAVKAVAQTAAQDAVKVTGTGLANVTDSTTGGVKTYNVDVKTGNLVVNAAGQAGAAGATGAGGAAGADGVATTQNVASAINDAITKSKTDTAQAIADAEHKFDGDTGTTSVRKHGEVLSVKGGVTNTADLTTGNIGVVSDGAGTLNIRLAKTLTGLTSAAFTDGTHTVTIAGSGIDAGNTEIKHVGKATTDDAAVNKKQMDDAVKAATDSVTTLGDNKVSLGSDSGTTTAKKLSTTGGIKFNIKGDTGANALITTSATGDDVTIAPTAKLSAAVTAAENSANKDLSNLSTAGNTYIQNLAKSAASWNVETNGAGTTAVAGGDTVNFINGDNIAITNTGRSITIGTAKNVSFDKVTVGGVVIDKNNGIDAGGKEITNVGPATSGNSAVNKTQMDTAITNAVNKATTDAKHDFGGDDATVVTRKHGEKLNIKGGASTTAADLTSGNIAVLGDAATGTLNIRMAKALTGLSSATFTTPSGTTVINGGGMTITPSTTGAAPISITTGGINAGNTEIKNVAAGTTPNSAVNKQQMDSAISNATANVGFSTAGNTGTGSVSNGQTLTITGTNGIETNASGQSITVGLDAATRAQINNATTTANNAAKKDLSNIDNAGKQVIKDTAAWNVKVNGAAAETVKGGDTVTFNDGDNIKVTNTGKDITIATKKDVSFDKVTVGNVVIDKNTNRISGLANAANNDEAVNLGQMNAAISTATAGTGNIKYKANGGTQNSVALTTGFDFKGDSNIQITADPANSGVINYKLNPALTGITSISGGTGAPTITLNAGYSCW